MSLGTVIRAFSLFAGVPFSTGPDVGGHQADFPGDYFETVDGSEERFTAATRGIGWQVVDSS